MIDRMLYSAAADAAACVIHTTSDLRG